MLTTQVVHNGYNIFFVILFSITAALESSILLHPSHIRHFLCHFEAFGPNVSSLIEVMRLPHLGHSRVVSKEGKGRLRELINKDDFTASFCSIILLFFKAQFGDTGTNSWTLAQTFVELCIDGTR